MFSFSQISLILSIGKDLVLMTDLTNSISESVKTPDCSKA